jgi:Ca2+-binding RTX toxin-like protein
VAKDGRHGGRRGAVTRALAKVLPAAVLLGSVVVVTGASPAQATLPGVNGRIACWSRQVGPTPAGNWDVLTMNPDGSGKANPGSHPLADLDPMYTPDGRQILFVSGRDNDESEVFIMNADGSNVRQIIDNGDIDDRPFTFHPGGVQVAFQRFLGNNEIFTMNIDGSNQVDISNNPASDASPDWSPDGQRIAFQSNRSGDTEIYTMKPDGTDVRLVIALPGADTFPRWDPTATMLTFAHNFGPGLGSTEIMRVNADGTNLVRLTNSATGDAFPVWSPDGALISWQSMRDDSSGDVYVMSAVDGSNVVRLTNRPGLADGICSWQRLGVGGALCTIAGIGTIPGTEGDDVICGSAAADSIAALGGNDSIIGGAGNDMISAGAGDDTVFGNEGDDQLVGGPGADSLFGGPGADRLVGDPGDTALLGGPGADLCTGRAVVGQCDD